CALFSQGFSTIPENEKDGWSPIGHQVAQEWVGIERKRSRSPLRPRLRSNQSRREFATCYASKGRENRHVHPAQGRLLRPPWAPGRDGRGGLGSVPRERFSDRTRMLCLRPENSRARGCDPAPRGPAERANIGRVLQTGRLLLGDDSLSYLVRNVWPICLSL